jgi:manganese-dependent inorganic pyrophosphatase
MALSAILSDTLEFRSPTTTRVDRQLAEQLAQDLGVDIPSMPPRCSRPSRTSRI